MPPTGMCHQGPTLMASGAASPMSFVSCLIPISTSPRLYSPSSASPSFLAGFEFLISRIGLYSCNCIRSLDIRSKLQHYPSATGCPAAVADRTGMKSHARISQLIDAAIGHDLPTPT